MTRYELTEIYLDYIDAYKHAAKHSGNIVPTVMFVYIDKNGVGNSPRENVIFSPHNIFGYANTEIKEVVKETHMMNGNPQYHLEMVIYTHIDRDRTDKIEQNIMFCARDVSGATIHTIYTLTKTSDRSSLMVYRNFGEAFHTWIPRDKKVPFVALRDNFIETIALEYAIETSMGGL